MSVASIGNNIIAALGYDSTAGDTSTTRIYDIDTNTWSFGSDAPRISSEGAGIAHGGLFYALRRAVRLFASRSLLAHSLGGVIRFPFALLPSLHSSQRAGPQGPVEDLYRLANSNNIETRAASTSTVTAQALV